PHSWLRHGSLEWPWRIACFPWWKVSCSRQRRMHYRPSNEPPPSKPGPPTIALPLRFPTTPSAAKPCTKAATIDVAQQLHRQGVHLVPEMLTVQILGRKAHQLGQGGSLGPSSE